ncbi:hypothetical protein HK096_007018 [Nowakowskiella sp. JEL0078]|nr:hypothetical protein HK096_007018 [Nowakowskiella sp. JEL0078]
MKRGSFSVNSTSNSRISDVFPLLLDEDHANIEPEDTFNSSYKRSKLSVTSIPTLSHRALNSHPLSGNYTLESVSVGEQSTQASETGQTNEKDQPAEFNENSSHPDSPTSSPLEHALFDFLSSQNEEPKIHAIDTVCTPPSLTMDALPTEEMTNMMLEPNCSSDQDDDDDSNEDEDLYQQQVLDYQKSMGFTTGLFPCAYQSQDGKIHWLTPQYSQYYPWPVPVPIFAYDNTPSGASSPVPTLTSSSSSTNSSDPECGTPSPKKFSCESPAPSITESVSEPMSPIIHEPPLLKSRDSKIPLVWEELPPKIPRRKTTKGQLEVLNRIFELWPTPSTTIRIVLGEELEMCPRAVQVWFQNKRQAQKKAQTPLTPLNKNTKRKERVPPSTNEETRAFKLIKELASQHYKKTGKIPTAPEKTERTKRTVVSSKVYDPKNPVWVFETPFFQARI